MARKIESFNFRPGRKVGQRYAIESRLGGGTEGEVYQICELDTGIQRAAKLYFPHRDPGQRTSVRLARKLHLLRHCSLVLQYHHSEYISIRKQKVLALISDLCAGAPLSAWVAEHPGGRLQPYLAMHVLYGLVRGLEDIHALHQYHADVHSDNILIEPCGVNFDLKLVDFYDWGRSSESKRQQDIVDAVHVFYECLGGRRHYPRQPEDVKYICAGLKRSLLLRRFSSITALRHHLETFTWSETVS